MKETTDAVVDLGRLALAFGRVDRITYHDNGHTPESDTDHTVMLGLVACAFAAKHLRWLDLGLVAQFALVHDLPEVYAGDTPSLSMASTTQEARAAKKQREAEASELIRERFGGTLPWLMLMLDEYECQHTSEARYVRAMDKLLPKITHLLNGNLTLRRQGMSIQELIERYAHQLNELIEYASDFPPLFDLRAELVAMVLDQAGAAV